MQNYMFAGAAILLVVSSASANPLDARQMGRGFTALNGSYLDAGSNPALATRFDETDDFGMNINAGALVSDQHEFVDSVDAISEDLETLEENIEGGSATQADVDNIVDSLRNLDRKTLDGQLGFSLNLGVPNHYLSATFISSSNIKIGASFYFDEQDEAYLNNALLTNNSNLDGLQSEAVVNAVAVSNVGIALGRAFELPAIGSVAFGLTPKIQRIDLFDYAESARDFDDDEFDANEYATEKTLFNIDFGVFKGFENGFRLAAHAENLIPVSLTSARGEAYEQNPVVVAGAGWGNNFVALDTSVDLTIRDGFGVIGDTQYLRMGAEFDAWRWAQLRVGFRHDAKGTDEDVITAGIGLSPFGVMNLDIGAAYGENDTYGAAIQLGFKM